MENNLECTVNSLQFVDFTLYAAKQNEELPDRLPQFQEDYLGLSISIHATDPQRWQIELGGTHIHTRPYEVEYYYYNNNKQTNMYINTTTAEFILLFFIHTCTHRSGEWFFLFSEEGENVLFALTWQFFIFTARSFIDIT